MVRGAILRILHLQVQAKQTDVRKLSAQCQRNVEKPKFIQNNYQ